LISAESTLAGASDGGGAKGVALRQACLGARLRVAIDRSEHALDHPAIDGADDWMLDGDVAERAVVVADALTAHGFAAHTESRNNQLRIVNNHCPFGDVAIEHPVICAVDRGMVKGMLGALYGDADVSTLASLPQGDTFCATVV
jgi:predicted ArsR family transcriptional regulator